MKYSILQLEKKRKQSRNLIIVLDILSLFFLFVGFTFLLISHIFKDYSLAFISFGLYLFGALILGYAFITSLIIKKEITSQKLFESILKTSFPDGTFEEVNKLSFGDFRKMKILGDFNFLNSQINFGYNNDDETLKFCDIELKNTNTEKEVFKGLAIEFSNKKSKSIDNSTKILIKTPNFKAVKQKALKEKIIDTLNFGNTFITYANDEKSLDLIDDEFKKRILKIYSIVQKEMVFYFYENKFVLLISDYSFSKIKTKYNISDPLQHLYENIYCVIDFIKDLNT